MNSIALNNPFPIDEHPGRKLFNLDKEYDLSKYDQRFKQQVSLVNPLRFFVSKKRILEAKEEVNAYRELQAQGDVSLTQGNVLLTDEEITRLKESSKIVGSAIHPDT